MRYDHYDSFGGELSPRAALIYQVSDNTTWKLLSGRAFRAPNMYEQFYHDNAFLKANPSGRQLQPETMSSYEIALEHRFSETMQGSASAFYYAIDNILEVTPDPTDGVSFFENKGATEARGIELQLKKFWQSGLETHLNYSWQKAEDSDTGEHLKASPKHLLKLRASLPLGPSWRANARLSYTDSMLVTNIEGLGHSTDAHEDIPSHVTTDLSLIGTPYDGLELGFYVYNLFDRDVYYPEEFSVRSERLKDYGRMFRFKVGYRF